MNRFVLNIVNSTVKKYEGSLFNAVYKFTLNYQTSIVQYKEMNVFSNKTIQFNFEYFHTTKNLIIFYRTEQTVLKFFFDIIYSVKKL